MSEAKRKAVSYWPLSPEEQAEIYNKINPVNFHGLTPFEVREAVMTESFLLWGDARRDNLKRHDLIWKAAV